MTAQICLLLVALASASPRLWERECPYVGVSERKESSRLVFEGTVTAIEWLEPHHQKRASVDVQRVWKGKPKKKTEVFHSTGTLNGYQLEVGESYLFFVRPMTTGDRHVLSPAAPDREMWAPDCSGVQMPTQSARKELGLSSQPD